MGRLARMVRQFPSSLPHCLILYFNCYRCKYWYFFLFLLLCCNRSVNGINKINKIILKFKIARGKIVHFMSAQRCAALPSKMAFEWRRKNTTWHYPLTSRYERDNLEFSIKLDSFFGPLSVWEQNRPIMSVRKILNLHPSTLKLWNRIFQMVNV